MSDQVPSQVWTAMRPEIREHLLAAKVHLVHNGTVRRRTRDGIYRIRYRDGEAHRSITLLDTSEMLAVEYVLNTWRAERDAEVEDKREKAAAQFRYRTTVAEARKAVLASHGGGGRRRRRISKEITAAAEDPPVLLSYLQLGVFAAPNRRPGRKPKGSLC